MANTSSKDVELRIRARDYSQKTLKQITTAITEMTKAQDQQRQSAERGETSAKDLEASYRKLESAGQALLKLNSLVEVYKRQSAALEDQRKKVELAVQKQQELQNQYNTTDKVTKKLETSLGRANAAVERANKAFDSAQSRVARTASELDRYGVSTTNLAQQQQAIVAGVGRVNSALERQDKIIQQVPSEVKRYNAAWDEAIATNNRMDEATRQAQLRMEEQAYAQDKVITNLRRQANEALAAAKGYQTLARVVATTTRGGNNGLASQLTEIVSPAAAARSSLAGLEKQVDSLARETAGAGKEITNAAQKLKDLQAAQQSAVGMAKLIDQFKQQVVAVRNARAAYQEARAEVRQLANQMRTAQTDSANFGQQMQAAQQKLNAAAAALRSTGTAARQTQGALRQAGVDTRVLSQEEDRLRNTTQQTVSIIDRLTEAVKRNSGATRDGAKAFSFFADSGRTTLSTMQRIRGEVLALVTTYAGLQGGINLAAGAIDIYKTRQQALIKISQVVGKDQNTLNAEWEYMIGLANRLGIKLEDVAKGYTSFAVAAKASGISIQQTRFIFESVAKAGRVFHLSADDMNGVFRALQQMLSKGQVYAEELTGQLGERLPAAVALFAKGMNMTTAELLKAMSNGEIAADAVINFARENAKAIDAELATAEKGVDAMEARAANAMSMFKLALADSGFIEAYVNMLAKLTEFLSSPDGKEAAIALGQAFSQAADAIVWCTQNVDTLITVLQVLAGIQVVRWLAGIYQGFVQLLPVMKKMGDVGQGILSFLEKFAARLATGTGAAKVLGIALGGLARAIPYVGWALLAYDIGAIFYQQSKTFAKAVDEVVRDFKNLANQIIAIIQTPSAALQDMAYAIVRPLTTLFASTLQSIAKWIADVLRLIPGVGDNLADWALQVADNLTKENRDMFQNVKGIWGDVNKEWNRMNDEIVKKYDNTMSDVVKKTLNAKVQMLQADLGAATGFQYTEDPGGGVTPRQREIQALTKEFDKQTKAAEKAELAGKKALQRKNLSGRLALVDEEYAPQMKRAQAVGGEEGKKLVAQLNAIIAARKRAETDEYNASQRSSTGIDKRARAIENLTQKYKELQASIQLKQTDQDPTASLADRISAAVAKSNTQFDELIAKSNKLGGDDGKRLAEQYTALKAVNAEYLNQKMQLEEVERLQNKVNSQMNIRKSRIEEVNSKRQAGVISEDQQVAAVNQINQETQSPIENSLSQLEAQAAASKDLLGPEKWAEIQAGIAATKASLVDLTGTFTTMDTTIVQGVLDGMATALNSIVAELVKVGTGAQNMGDAFAAAGVAVLQFFAQFLQKIAIAILQQMALNAIAGMGGGIGSAAAAMGGVAAKHNGGVIGNASGEGQQTRSMNPAWFVNARRYHDGGLPGLKSDEVPAILQKGEQVLDKNDPNNILNQNASQSSSQSPGDSYRFVLVDDRAKVPEAMNTPEGEKAILQILTRNAPTVRNIVGKKSNGRNG
nr:hypothetical protein SLP22_00051 [Salmonella phage BAU.Micro_SLP-22]